MEGRRAGETSLATDPPPALTALKRRFPCASKTRELGEPILVAVAWPPSPERGAERDFGVPIVLDSALVTAGGMGGSTRPPDKNEPEGDAKLNKGT